MDPEIVLFKTFEHTRMTEGQFATLDAVANITAQITAMGVYYGVDYNLAEVFYNEDGEQTIQLEFKDSKTAMLVKLKSIKKDYINYE
jgi:hypothetical protein